MPLYHPFLAIVFRKTNVATQYHVLVCDMVPIVNNDTFLS